MKLVNGGSGCEGEYKVIYSDCDINGNMKPEAVLRLIQEISLEHCNLLNMDEKFFIERNRAFMLAELNIRMTRPIREKEGLIISSFPQSVPLHARYRRNTYIKNEKTGESLVTADAKWILINLETGRIERKAPEDIVFPEQNHAGEDLSIKIPKNDFTELLNSQKHTVRYSQMDSNKHLNNTYYASIISDSLPFEIFEEGRTIKNLTISYRSQGLWGDEIKVRCFGKKDDNSCYYIRGDRSEVNLEEEKNPFYFEGYVEI